MSFKYGFYNSVNGDRRYDAVDFGRIFDGVINDGVFGTVCHSCCVLMMLYMGTPKVFL